MQTSDYNSYQDAKERLDQIVVDVRRKDISLESSLDLLEEGVALANKCTELIDVASWSKEAQQSDKEDAPSQESAGIGDSYEKQNTPGGSV